MVADQPFHIDPSATASFSALNAEALPHDTHVRDGHPLKAVVVGGGTGAPMSIRVLLSLGIETSAVVAMADDGGSTGILRDEADVTPPGDVRKCIAAFARNPRDPLVRAFRYRLAAARDHALGNLMLAALEDACGSFVDAIAICERLVDAQGHVYPSTLDHVTLEATTRDGRVLDSQAAACHSRTALESVSLRSLRDEPVSAYEPALRALREADLIVLGPGSLFTSILPNVLVPGIVDAMRASRGRVLFVCSIADVQGETWGLTAREHVEALFNHGLEGVVDYVLVHSPVPLRADDLANDCFNAASGMSSGQDSDLGADEIDFDDNVIPVRITYHDMQAIQSRGPVVVVRDLADDNNPLWHAPKALREAFEQVISLSHRRESQFNDENAKQQEGEDGQDPDRRDQDEGLQDDSGEGGHEGSSEGQHAKG